MEQLTLLDDPDRVDDAPRLGRKRDHTRDSEILDAALDVLAESGYDGMTVDMVAARAKAGKATLYRRWPSKEDLVLDAVACMKPVETDFSKLPDTGTLRGDLIALMKPPTIKDGERKMQIMAGVMSMLSKNPELAGTLRDVMVVPRLAVNRFLMGRAIERGEIRADADVDTISMVSQSMVSFRVLMERKPVTREYLLSIIDEVILPALRI